MAIANIESFDTILENAIKTFRKTFNMEPDIAACAPGRVNLIGEHIDYNDGYVLPVALPMVTLIVGKRNDDKSKANITTYCIGVDEPKSVQLDLECLKPGHPKWANYVKGVIKCYGMPVPGFNAVIMTNVPIGGGLSSSASLEVATITFIEALIDKGTTLTLKDKALICQRAEHEFAGMPCGIMDQLISVMGQQRHALLIDCQSLEVVQIPFEADDLAILICNSNVRHELSHSEYPTRRKQCEKALELMGLKSYKDATVASLDALNDAEEVLIKRARHVVTEITRTYQAAEALRGRDFKKMGLLMIESHKSLRDDFEVSCKELDILVDAAIDCSGVLGSRMCGGGFGGCTVTLVAKDSVAVAIAHINTVYEKNGYGNALFFVCEPSEGARLIHLA